MIEGNEMFSFSKIGSRPIWQKGIIVLGACVSITYGIYWGYLQAQFNELKSVQQEEVTLKEELALVSTQINAMHSQKENLVKIQNRFNEIIKHLPSKTEIPGLLEDISKKGRFRGLHFELFDPLDEHEHDFYVELPIRISVTGNYDELAGFISDVASLDRIVTIHKIDIVQKNTKRRRKSKSEETKKLTMDILAKTYRYKENKTNG